MEIIKKVVVGLSVSLVLGVGGFIVHDIFKKKEHEAEPQATEVKFEETEVEE